MGVLLYSAYNLCWRGFEQALQSSLGPLVSSLLIPPDLIDIIVDTEPSEVWINAVADLEDRLTAIRSGPRVAARKDLDDVAEKLRIKVKIPEPSLRESR